MTQLQSNGSSLPNSSTLLKTAEPHFDGAMAELTMSGEIKRVRTWLRVLGTVLALIGTALYIRGV